MVVWEPFSRFDVCCFVGSDGRPQIFSTVSGCYIALFHFSRPYVLLPSSLEEHRLLKWFWELQCMELFDNQATIARAGADSTSVNLTRKPGKPPRKQTHGLLRLISKASPLSERGQRGQQLSETFICHISIDQDQQRVPKFCKKHN